MERFVVTYRIAAPDRDAAAARARAVAVEQTVEFPVEAIPERHVHEEVIGFIEGVAHVEPGAYSVVIGYPAATAGGELLQLLTVIFGNISIQPGVRVEHVALPPSLRARFPGPRFGIAGVRRLLGVHGRPLLASAVKPMGLSARALAARAYEMAAGGIDIIKDDHGLTDQGFAPFAERVAAVADAVRRANEAHGTRTLYAPNITSDRAHFDERVRIAMDAGAGMFLISPGLTGFDAMAHASALTGHTVPLMGHPAFLGTFTVSPASGIAHRVLYGELMRLAGADAAVFPNWGGRFSFTRDECLAIAAACRDPFDGYTPIFPTPGGGMSVARYPELAAAYGSDAIFLIGGGLFTMPGSLRENCQHLSALCARHASSM